jgi:hypothetical protein
MRSKQFHTASVLRNISRSIHSYEAAQKETRCREALVYLVDAFEAAAQARTHLSTLPFDVEGAERVRKVLSKHDARLNNALNGLQNRCLRKD